MPELTPVGKTVEKLEEKVKELEEKHRELSQSMSLFEKGMDHEDMPTEIRVDMINPCVNFIVKKLKVWHCKKQLTLLKIEKIEKRKNYKRYV